MRRPYPGTDRAHRHAGGHLQGLLEPPARACKLSVPRACASPPTTFSQKKRPWHKTTGLRPRSSLLLHRLLLNMRSSFSLVALAASRACSAAAAASFGSGRISSSLAGSSAVGLVHFCTQRVQIASGGTAGQTSQSRYHYAGSHSFVDSTHFLFTLKKGLSPLKHLV